MCETSHASSGWARASAAATGRPRSAQHTSCRPCVQTHSNDPAYGVPLAEDAALVEHVRRELFAHVIRPVLEQALDTSPGELPIHHRAVEEAVLDLIDERERAPGVERVAA